MTVTAMSDHLAPAISGPWVEAVCLAISDVLATGFDIDFEAAMDTRSPVWDEARPLWHLTLLEGSRPAHVVPIAAAPGERYRALRMYDVAEYSQGLWSDLLQLAAAWCQTAKCDASKVRVFAYCLHTVWLLSPSVEPVGASLEILRSALLATIQDVAGYTLMVGVPDLVFTFDIGPGFDVGILADIVDTVG